MDGRTLIGSYVCTEKPGEFKWSPGSLTQVCAVGTAIHSIILLLDFIFIYFSDHTVMSRLLSKVSGLCLKTLTKHPVMCSQSYYLYWKVQVLFRLVMQR